MKNRDISINRILFFLDGKDKFALRKVSTGCQNLLKENQEAPYKNKVEFAIAVSGLFYKKAYFTIAWTNYHFTTTSTSMKPSMLYKIADMQQYRLDGTYQQFLAGEDAEKTGRVYCPGSLHAMDVNTTWLLANLHHHRSFVIYSELSPAYVKRKDFPSVYSAFAKEVGTAIKAGYTISFTEEGRVQLNPSQHKSTEQLGIKDIIASDTEIQAAIDQVNDAKKIHQEAINAAKHCRKLFVNIEIYNLQELQLFLKSLSSVVDVMFNELFSTCKNKKIALDSLIKEFNLNKPDFSKNLLVNNNLYFDVNKIEITKRMLFSLLDKRTKELIEIAQHDKSLTMTKKNN